MEDDLPPSLDGPDSMKDHWFEKTTITVDKWCKANLDHERNNQPWTEYLEELRQSKADPLTLNGVDEIAERLTDELDADIDVDELEDRIVTRLARETQSDLQSFEEQLEEIANSASMASEPTFGDEQVTEILNRIDDLQSQLPKDVAKEVSQRQ